MAEKTMVERVARAMHDAYEEAAIENSWVTNELCRVPFDELPDENKATMRASARAAIEAMREPTEDMVDAGAVAEGDGNLEAEARNLWDAMIDAALKE